MGIRCVVPGCDVRARNKPDYVTLHRFPVSPQEMVIWLDRCGITSGHSLGHWRVCSNHFSATDYLEGQEGALRNGAIPIHNLTSIPIYGVVVRYSGKTNRIKIPISTTAVITLELYNNPTMRRGTASFTINGAGATHSQASTRTVPSALYRKLSLKYEQMKTKNRVLQSELQTCRQAKKASIGRSHHEKRSHRMARMKLSQNHEVVISKLQQKLNNVQKHNTKLETGFGKLFTSKQIQMVIDDKRKMMWTNEEIAKAISLRYQSNPYDNLRMRGFPFPASRTLRRAIQGITFTPGIIYPVMNLLKHAFSNASIQSKACILSFDELSIDSSIAYDPHLDQVLGPKSNVNVYFLRGLFSKWKQPIAFECDDTFSPSKFKSLLRVIGEIGLCVHGVVSDLGGKNRGLMNKLGVNVRKSNDSYLVRHQIPNQTFPGTEIQFFADLPHLLKLLRNNMITHGIKVKGGYWIRKSDYERLVDVDKDEFQSNWKLNKTHLNLVGKQKQKVLPAFQTFSKTVAQLWRKVFVNRAAEATFIELVNDFCDLMNTRCLTGSTPTKKPFGLELGPQMEILEKMEDAMMHLRVGKATNLYPFQKGFLMSIHSMRKLFAQVSAPPLGQKFIFGNKLNTDLDENCFSMVRKVGGYNENPDPVDCKNRLKLVCLGWNDTTLSTSNVRMDEKSGFLTGEMIKALKDQSLNETEPTTPITVTLPEERPAINQFDLDNFDLVMENFNIMESCERGGQEYVCGFVASKYKSKYPELAADKDELELVRKESWVLKLSEGQLTVPSLFWRNQCQLIHREIYDYSLGFKYGLNTNPGILKAFTTQLEQKYPEIHPEPLRKFVKTVIFIRIKPANKRIKEERKEKYRSIMEQKYRRGIEAELNEDLEGCDDLFEEEEDYNEVTPWDQDEDPPFVDGRCLDVEDNLVASFRAYLRDESQSHEDT